MNFNDFIRKSMSKLPKGDGTEKKWRQHSKG